MADPSFCWTHPDALRDEVLVGEDDEEDVVEGEAEG